MFRNLRQLRLLAVERLVLAVLRLPSVVLHVVHALILDQQLQLGEEVRHERLVSSELPETAQPGLRL